MRTTFKTSMLLFIAVPLLFISCAKNDTIDKQDVTNTVNESNLKTTTLAYCGTPVTASMVE
ncbi:MAG: hypothetical protein IPH20_13095 [Bacteroidales bacterium]|nr:hypothetical protein [Bacteroidales bacterium]